MENRIIHPLPPIYDNESRVLILGTMPSPISRAKSFYYANPQNRFWKAMSVVFDCEIGTSNDERIEFLLMHHIALWDVLHSCEITGASDESIKNPVANDIKPIVDNSKITEIFTTGNKAQQLYSKLCAANVGIDATRLPSTSPANCRYYSFEGIVKNYQIIKQCI